LGGSCGAITEIRRRYRRTGKNTKNPAKKNSEIENLEEDRRRKYTAFIPTNSHDYQNDAGSHCWARKMIIRPRRGGY